MPEISLLLLGHGSHLDPNSSAPVHAIADRIRPLGVFARVDVAFWKEEPAVSRWSDRYCVGETVIAVPVFISDGYFTREVLPRELGLPSGEAFGSTTGHPRGGQGPLRARIEGIDLRCTPPVGTHPSLAEVVRERAIEAGAGPSDAVAVLGHGTRRNPQSETNVYAQAERVRAMGAFAEVVTVFMDQAPEMSRVFELTAAERVFMVPLFIAEGWHVGQTIPEDMGFGAGDVCLDGRRLRYTTPVGTHPRMVDLVLELAAEALA